MEYNHTVDDTMMESVLDDAAPAPEIADALSEALGVPATEPAVEAEQQVEDDHLEEPQDKGMRGRMKQFEQRGYKRGAQEAESKWAEERKGYQEKLARYEQMELEAEARKFAQEKNIPEEIALDYMRMKKGMPAAAEQPRDDNGRFAQQAAPQSAPDADVQARAAALMTQAAAFEKMSDGNVTKDAILDAFQNDSEVRQKVVSGEWDFTDVGRALSGGQQRAPRVSRSASNGKIGTSTFLSMSDDDFASFDERIRQGAVFDARR